MGASPHVVPLRRNRDFLLLQAGQLLSAAGTQSTTIAYPLLVLALTHSAAKAGIVAFVRAIPYPLFSLLAGAAADRWPRRRLMLVADCVGIAAIGALAALVLLHRLPFWALPVVAFAEACGFVLFQSSAAGALRSVVPARQLPAAAAAETGRIAAVRLIGPPLGGALFGIARALPFVVDAGSYVLSMLSLVAMRTPFEEAREPDRSPLRARLAEGVRFLWARPFLRTCALLFGIGNVMFPGLLLAMVVIGRGQGLSAGEIGALVAVFGVALLVGAFLSALSRRALSMRAILLLELWTWTGCALFLVWPSVYALAVGTVPTALAVPSTDSVVHGYRIAVTPDRLVGRVEGAARSVSLLVAPLGPLAAGLLLASVSARETIAVFAGCGLVLALWGTLSPSIRRAPSLAELEGPPAAEPQPAMIG